MMFPTSAAAAAAAAATMNPAAARHPVPGGPQPTQPFKFTVADSCERIKDEFNFLQAQYHSLKVELEKLAQEKTEMQRHYVMYYEMSYGLNVEMHKQTEIAKRLSAILVQIMPFLSPEHQQQVAAAVDRAKQVTMTELNAIIGQQMHAAQVPVSGHAPPPFPGMLTPGPPPLPPTSAAGILALTGGLGPHPMSLLGSKAEAPHIREEKPMPDTVLRNSARIGGHRAPLFSINRMRKRTT
ncbi:unnamed protein product [Notodromas monacha]|uniref:Groucho/TLE N-terminal Q-rich domain-containing protein n=1 Tax=Notodromas monacha TaxID=399045 RepID=A0A7R9G7Z1_9CRUS|nr:unnamed protein product [Notodromas monacha]CAG0912576.1 unnamed protein product [Notodromas monacha]